MQAHYSTGAVASSFTSTAQVPVTQQEAGTRSSLTRQTTHLFLQSLIHCFITRYVMLLINLVGGSIRQLLITYLGYSFIYLCYFFIQQLEL